VESDLSQIYSPVLGNITATNADKTQPFWSAPLRSDGFRRTRFTGKPEKVTFVANNNRRVEADSPQSEFQKIIWEVDRNTSNTYTLYRTTDWDAFRYEDNTVRKPERVAILENLSSAKFSFYRKANKTWENSWDSEDSYAKEESRFPDLVRLKLESPNPTNNANQLTWELVVRPNMQLNYLDEKAKAAAKKRFLE
jgi:hypothetical protein